MQVDEIESDIMLEDTLAKLFSGHGEKAEPIL
jgi:hypothetical protein